MLPVKKAEVAAPCRKVTLDRRLCRTLQMDTVAKCPLETGELSQKRTLVPKKRLERKRTRLTVLEKDIRQEVASDDTTESETEVAPRRQNTFTDKSRDTATAAGKPCVGRRGNQCDESPTTWKGRTSDPSGLRCISGEVRKMGGTPRKRCRDQRRNRRRNVHLDKSEFEKGSPASSGERLVSASVNKNPSLRRHDAREVQNTGESLQG